MQKTAFKVFLCSFSVSMLAISVANKAFLHQKLKNAPLEISNKNISLFVKNTHPVGYPVKKIDLSVLDAPETIDPSKVDSDSFTDTEIIVADDLDYLNPVLDTDVATESINTDEDQTIFLADVVYSQTKPLEKLTIDEPTVYSPDPQPVKVADNTVKPKIEKSIEEEKIVVYSAEPEFKPEKAEITEVKVADNDKPDAPVPLLYDKIGNSSVNISIGQPSDLSHVAMKIDNIPIESMTNSNNEEQPGTSAAKEWKQMKDNPWLIAKSNGISTNRFADKEFANTSDDDIKKALDVHKQKQGVQTASETVKNLIIPLPDNLADNENLMPKLAYPENSADAKKEKAMSALSLRLEKEKEKQKLLTEIDDDDVEMSMIPPQEENQADDSSLFSSLGALLSNTVKNPQSKITEAKTKSKTRASARRKLRKAAEENLRPITPKEIKMSFQANRAEISGQTLRWVQAFAAKAAQEDNIYLEVRVDGSRPTLLQQRRLNLLYNILTHKGVEYSKINVVYTAREPNSFILRMVNLSEKEKGNIEKIKNSSNNYVQW